MQKNTWIFKPRHCRQSGGNPGGSEGKDSAWNAGDQVRSLGRENPVEKGMVTPSITLACQKSWTEEPGGLQSMSVTKSQTRLSNQHFHFSFS